MVTMPAHNPTRKKRMTEKLKRKVTEATEATNHKILDLVYLAGAVLGFSQLIEATKAINAGMGNTNIYLLAAQMAILAVCSSLAYVWHITGKVFAEMSVSVAVLAGYISLLIGSIVTQVTNPVKEPFYVSMSGMGIGLALWFIIELIIRFHKIETRKRQIKASQKMREIVEIPTAPEVLEAKAEEIKQIIKKG